MAHLLKIGVAAFSSAFILAGSSIEIVKLLQRDVVEENDMVILTDLEKSEGQYDTRSIVLNNTNHATAKNISDDNEQFKMRIPDKNLPASQKIRWEYDHKGTRTLFIIFSMKYGYIAMQNPSLLNLINDIVDINLAIKNWKKG